MSLRLDEFLIDVKPQKEWGWLVITYLFHGGTYVVLAFWFFVGVICDAAFIVHARRSLLGKFRTLAATPYEESTGLIGNLGRMFGRSIARPQADPGEAPPVIR